MQSTIVGVVVGLLLMSAGARAQSALWELDEPPVGPLPVGSVGAHLALLGDLDLDGTPDVAVGLPQLDKVRLRGGGDGSFLTAFGGQPGSRFGSALAAVGDVDGDGVPDLAVGAPEFDTALLDHAGELRVISGASGAPIWTLRGESSGQQLGSLLVRLDDVDQDGVHDLAVRHGDGGSARLLVVSGATGAVLNELASFVPYVSFAVDAASGRDLDQDGVDDLVVVTSPGSPAATITAYSGATLAGGSGQLIFHTTLVDTNAQLTVCLPGDLDGDGLEDVLVADPLVRSVRRLDAIGNQVGFLAEAVVPEIVQFPWGVTAVGDLDGDGHGDLMAQAFVSDPQGQQAYWIAISGHDGEPLFATHGPGVQIRRPVAADLDGDGQRDVILTFTDPPVTGQPSSTSTTIRAVSGDQGSWQVAGESCSADPQQGLQLHALGDPVPGGQLTVFLSRTGVVTSSLPALLLLGLPAAPTVLAGGCSLHVAPVLATVPLTLGGVYERVAFDVPATAVAFDVSVQGVALAPGSGLLVSEAVSVAIAD